jgi:hypothetical protein
LAMATSSSGRSRIARSVNGYVAMHGLPWG